MNNKQLLKLIGWSIGLCLATAIIWTFFDSSHQESFRKGYDAGYSRTTDKDESQWMKHPQDYVILVSPRNASTNRVGNAIDSLNTITGAKIKLVSENSLYSIWSKDAKFEKKPFYMQLLIFFGIILYVVIFITFINIIRLFSTGEVLTKATYTNLLALAISIILLPIVMYTFSYIDYLVKVNAFSATNYEVYNRAEFESLTFILGLVFLGLVLALKIGVKIKEENELTI